MSGLTNITPTVQMGVPAAGITPTKTDNSELPLNILTVGGTSEATINGANDSNPMLKLDQLSA